MTDPVLLKAVSELMYIADNIASLRKPEGLTSELLISALLVQ